MGRLGIIAVDISRELELILEEIAAIALTVHGTVSDIQPGERHIRGMSHIVVRAPSSPGV